MRSAYLRVLLTKRPGARNGLSLDERVRAAISSARHQSGIDESLDDVAGVGGYSAFAKTELLIIDAFQAARAAAVQIATAMDAAGDANPALTAAMRVFPAPEGVEWIEHAQRVIGLHRQIADLAIDAEAEELGTGKRGRGRPSSRDPVVKGVVRAAMHHLYLSGVPFSGGWKYVRQGRSGRAGMRSTDAELAARDAADFVANVVRKAGFAVTRPELKGHMDEYVKLLKAEKRVPENKDYMVSVRSALVDLSQTETN